MEDRVISKLIPDDEALALEEHIKARIDYWHTYDCTWGHRKLRKKLAEEDGIKIGRKIILQYMTEYQDSVDRIEVERKFSLSKRKFRLGLIMTKLESTTKASVWLSIIAMNLDRLAVAFFAFLPHGFYTVYLLQHRVLLTVDLRLVTF